MELVQASDAAQLTGLTPHQLREWCGRRGMVAPDVPPAGPGRHALYSWQSLLTLRLLKELHDRFAAEVGPWKIGMGKCQTILRGRAFPSLWGLYARFSSLQELDLVAPGVEMLDGTSIWLALDPHLEVLAAGLALPGPPSQLPLFPAVMVRR